jgi:hypothetical protein
MTTAVDFLSTSSPSWLPTAALRYKKINEISMKEEGEEEEGEEGEEEEGEEGEEEESDKKSMKKGEKGLSEEDRNDVIDSEGEGEGAEPLSVCGVDCEMCYTAAGLELTRVSNIIVIVIILVTYCIDIIFVISFLCQYLDCNVYLLYYSCQRYYSYCVDILILSFLSLLLRLLFNAA